MCGVLGVLEETNLRVTDAEFGRALAALRHRGPDDEGVWSEDNVRLGHRRLSVVDLSPAGRQPMISACGRFIITYNGEIYNFPELKAELEARGARRWRGTSDTEVLLQLIADFGVEAALERANGMFALAVWDRSEKRLHLARDRFGKKPLYYAARGKAFAFASELSALEAFSSLQLAIDEEALARYFVRGYLPAPHSIYGGVCKLPPGCRLSWRAGEAPSVRPYWRLDDVIRSRAADQTCVESPDSIAEKLDSLIQKATATRMVADVPVGVFLSGGIDSSLIAAAMQKCASRPITTFTLGFEDPGLSEAENARAVARHLGTNHIEETVTAAQALDVVSRLGDMYDEPLCDDSQIPTYLVSALARKHVTVALSGDGGDELFGGYRRYDGTPALWKLLRKIPFASLGSRFVERTPAPVLDIAFGFLRGFSNRYGKGAGVGQTMRRIAPWMSARSLLELYEFSLAKWPHRALPLRSVRSIDPDWRQLNPPVSEDVDVLSWYDQHNYLPGDILTKVDRASMAVSLETRVPLLDPEVAAFAWSLPPAQRTGKAMLRSVLNRHLPAALFDRPKTGFTPPLEAWLLGPLRSWADDLLSPARLQRQGLLDARSVASFWKRYKAGGTLEDFRAWSVLMLQAWLEARGK
jgi:asparagine synthase (glutamine-hydrolysing)